VECIECGKREASIFIRRSGSEGLPGSDLALCESCARRRGISAGKGQLAIRFEELLAPPGDPPSILLSCAECSSSLEALRERGRLGCAACAEVFRPEIGARLRRRARPPWFRDQAPGAPREARVLAAAPDRPRLEAELRSALAAEDYEKAARLRDAIAHAEEGRGASGQAPRPTEGGKPDPALSPAFGLLPRAEAPSDDVILSSQVRLVRNYADLPFPASPSGGASPSRSRAAEALSLLPGLDAWRLGETPENFGRFLAERGLASRAWTSDPDSMLGLGREDPLVLLADETDHLVLLAVMPGLAPRPALAMAQEAGRALESGGRLAFDPEFGWLSPRLDSLGTGLSLSLRLHLPALSSMGMTDRVLGPLLESGLAIHGIHGAEEGSAGDIFEVMTEHAYGATTEAMVAIVEAAAGVAAPERRARAEIAMWKGEELLDRSGRALGLLRHARRLEQGEAAAALSTLRLGALAGRVAGLDSREAGRYLGLLGPASLACEARRLGFELPVEAEAASSAARLRSLLLGNFVAGARLVEGGQ
jgi:protein arginine kinase